MTALEPFELGTPGPLRNRLVAAVLAGEKTATSSLLVDYDDEELPRPGDRYVLVDSAGAPVAIVEVTKVRIIRLADADAQLALDEGEGFGSVAEWREAHEAYWNAEGRPDGDVASAFSVNDDTRVVVEWFRVVPASV